MIDFGHLSFANTQALNRKKTLSEGQDSKADMEGKEFICTLLITGNCEDKPIMLAPFFSLYGVKLLRSNYEMIWSNVAET